MTVVPGVFRRYQALAALGVIGLCTLACTGSTDSGPGGGSNGATGGSGQMAGGGASNTGGGNAAGSSGAAGVDTTNGGPKLRVLTQAEYKNSLTDLLGPISASLTLPDDTFVGGFTAIGGSELALNVSSVELYEAASRAATAEVFGDATRWQKLVGCQPQADLSDACTSNFVKTFGKRAFRRDLTDAEVQQWVKVGKDSVAAGATVAQGLAAITSGLIQSPYFLYRVEINKKDVASGRLKYDGASMATRLAFLVTGHPPSDALLSAAASGQLDTPDGLKAAAAPLLTDASAVDRMSVFFNELSRADLVMVAQKSTEMFPNFSDPVRNSMLQATQLFIKNIVLAPGADVRSFFDSDQSFVDATLASYYGVSAPASGFAQIKLAADSGRAGILGQAAVVAGHSQPDHTSPTRRGVFISESFLCATPPSPPAGVITTLPDTPNTTWRQKLEQHRTNPSCAACHALFDPLGMALEKLDSVGKFRSMENGQPLDATGTLDGVAFDGEAQLGTALRGNSRAMACLMNNFYRHANGVSDTSLDSAQLDALGKTLAAKNYVWRDLVAEFIVSDAFRSAPAAPVMGGKQ